MAIALTSDQQDLAEAVAGFTARHAAVSETRAAFGKIAAGEVQPSWQALVGQGLHAIHLPDWAGGDGAGLVELAVPAGCSPTWWPARRPRPRSARRGWAQSGSAPGGW